MHAANQSRRLRAEANQSDGKSQEVQQAFAVILDQHLSEMLELACEISEVHATIRGSQSDELMQIFDELGEAVWEHVDGLAHSAATLTTDRPEIRGRWEDRSRESAKPAAKKATGATRRAGPRDEPAAIHSARRTPFERTARKRKESSCTSHRPMTSLQKSPR